LENVDISYGHLEYLTDFRDILGPFSTFCVHLVHFSGFGILCQQKSGNPACVPHKAQNSPSAISPTLFPTQFQDELKLGFCIQTKVTRLGEFSSFANW
jgi:hypothetical protein